jgi:hypothetical protein
LLSRPYFSRLWILQEIATGDDDSLILCGNKVTTWGAMYNLYRSLRISDTETNDSELSLIFRTNLELHSAAYEAYRDVRFYIWKQVEDYRTLQDGQRGGFYRHSQQLFTRCRTASYTEPRDRVYGMLGLLGPHLASKITVDYDASIAHVYTSFTKAWIEHTNKLEILVECGESREHYSRDDTIPSWVVDLKQEIKSQVGNYDHRY